MVFQAKRLDWRVVAGATAFVAGDGRAEDDPAPVPLLRGARARRSRRRSRTTGTGPRTRCGIGLFGILALSLGLIALRRRRWVGPLTAVLLLGWMLAGEISMTVGIDNGADQYRANLPAQLNWVDARVHGQPVTYLGQAILDPIGEQLTEFWNRSIKHVDEPRRDRARAGADVDPESRQPRRAPLGRLGQPLRPRRHRRRPRRPGRRRDRER